MLYSVVSGMSSHYRGVHDVISYITKDGFQNVATCLTRCQKLNEKIFEENVVKNGKLI